MDIELKKIERFEDFLKNERVGPYTLDIKLTNKCNLNCVFCPTKMELGILEKVEEVSDEIFMDLIEEASKFDVKEVYIGGGGEPSIRKKLLLNLMGLIKRKNMRGILITNGTLLNDEDIKEIISIGWDDVSFSIDGPNPKINDFLRGKKGAFKLAINNLKSFKRVKKELSSELPRINISTIILNKNYKYLPKMIKLAYKMNSFSFDVQKFVPWSKNHLKYELSDEQKEILPFILDKSKKLVNKFNLCNNILGYETTFLSSKIEKHSKKNSEKKNKCKLGTFCKVPFLYFSVRVSGDVGPCLGRSKTIIGNIKEDTLSSIWFGEEMKKFRNSLIKGKTYSYCNKCCAKITNTKFDSIIEKNKK